MKRYKNYLLFIIILLTVFLSKSLYLNLYSTSNSDTENEFILIIDPAHGGDDFGAVSGSNLKEKDITLEIALMLVNLINKNNENDESKIIGTILTRNTDNYASAEQRTIMSNKNKGNLFLSIHANYSSSNSASGFSIFCHEAQFKSRKKTVMLWDEVQNNYIVNSKHFGDMILKKINKALNEEETKIFSMVNLGILQCPLLPLKGINMPAVVLEIGFLSHSMDEAFMKDGEYKNRLTNGIYEAVSSYKEQYFKK